MKTLLLLAFKSALNRKLSILLAMISIAVSVTLFIGIDKIRKEARSNFLNTISQTDLIVGARGSPINLLLYSIFHLGDATNNISWQTHQSLKKNPQIKWTIPLSLGDSYRGFRVVGTTADFFKFYKYGGGRSVLLQSGTEFTDLYDAVAGYEVAHKLNLELADKITLTHGTGELSDDHADKPFQVSGILAKTGTPIDRVVLVSLRAIEAIHIDWRLGAKLPIGISQGQTRKMRLVPQTISAFMLGLHDRINTFRLQRTINKYRKEPLTAIIPGAALAKFWRTMAGFEQVLLFISILVLVATLTGMLTTLLASLNERRREMALLRAVGARPYHIIALFICESLIIMAGSLIGGMIMLYAGLGLVRSYIQDTYGIFVNISALDAEQMVFLLIALATGVLISLVPGIIAYTRSLNDGLAVKV